MNETEFNSLPLAQRKAAQQRLIDAGLYSGSADGVWGKGTAAGFKAEEKRRVEDAERARKGGLEEKKVEAEAAKTKAEAAAAQAKAEEEERKTKARKERSDQAATPQGIATQIGANVLSPMAGTAVGMGMGKVTNLAMDKAQESRNKVLRGVAGDRLAGRTTTAGAREGARLSGSVPMASPAMRTTARMLPHMGLGALSIGKGAQILSEEDPEGPFYPEMANRAAGLGYIGAGAGLAKQGLRYGAAPGVAPDAQALAIINSNQLRRNGIGGTLDTPEPMSRGPLKSIDAEVIPDEPQQKALPAPKETEGKRKHSERLISAARSGGATGVKSKSAAATWIEANLSDENRAAIAKELGVKPGPKFQQRVLTAVKNMAKKPGASAIVPALAGGTAFLASPDRAEASRTGEDFTGADEALTNAGIAGGLAYGTGKAIEALPRVAGRAAGAGLSALVPFMAADAYDPTPEQLNRDRNIAARYFPSFMRAGGVEEAYQMAQVPERSPVGAGPRLAQPENPDAAIEEALGIVRRANGGRVSGGFHFDTGGRTDNIPLDVVPGTYIIPADVVSALGQGNTMAGIKVLDNMFPPQAEVKQPKAAGGRADPKGGSVPIIVAGGEFKIDPYHVAALGEGDVEAGADMLDEWVQSVRQQHIDTLKSLPGPAESATEEGRNRAPFEQGGHARSVSEDDVEFGVNPIDELREKINTSVFTPEQAAANRDALLWEALSVLPGPGNVIAAQDAYTGAGDAYDAFKAGDYKSSALASALAGLSGAGAVLGLPFGKYAKGAAEAGKDTFFSGLPMDDASRMARARQMGYADEPFYRGEASGKPYQGGPAHFSRDEGYAAGFANKGGADAPAEYRLNLSNTFSDRGAITAAKYGALVEAAAATDPKLALDLAESIAPGKGVEWLIGFSKARPDFVVVDEGGAALVRHAIERGSSDPIGVFRAAGYDALDSGRDVRKLDAAGIRSKDAQFNPSKASSTDIMAGLAGASLLPAWLVSQQEATSRQD